MFILSSNMTLQQVQTYFKDLATETDSDILTSIQLEDTGGVLSIHWNGSGPEALPREANIYFGTRNDIKDQFLFACVIDPHLYMWAVDEGLDDDKATNAAFRWIESVEEVENYFKGKPYKHIHFKQIEENCETKG